MRLTQENLSACKAFVDFWDDHVIISSVRVFYRHPSLQKKPLMVMCLMSDDFNVFKIHMMMMVMNMHASLELWSNIRTAFLCSEIRVFSALSVWP